MKPISALIVDDEPLARAHIRMTLESLGIAIAGEAASATDALRIAEELRPTVLFLDIQMPGMSGLHAAAALQSLEQPPLVVFVTGYSEHAVAAFERDALDYLVKPVAPERLARTLERIRARIAHQKPPEQPSHREAIDRQAAGVPLRRIPIREDYSVRLIRIDEVVCAVSREKRVYIRAGDAEHRTYYTLTQLEAMLPADSFLRIHDSCIVRLELVEELLFLGNHSYMVRLSNGMQLPVGRSRYPALQRCLGMDGAG